MYCPDLVRKTSFTGLVLVLLLTIITALAPLPTHAGLKTNAWNKYPIPRNRGDGGWVLTSDATSGEETGVTAIGTAYDGTIYAATKEIAGSSLNGYNLFRSTDGGYSWTPLWRIPASDNPGGSSEIISIILPRREDSDILYLATPYNIYKSTDGGERFAALGRPPTSAALITSADVSYDGGSHRIVVGTRDAGAGSYGGAFFYDEARPFSPWVDLRIGGGAAGTVYDVLAVAFSPNFTDDRQVVAVVTDEVDTIVTTKVGGDGWGATIGDAALLDPASSSWAATEASLAFPADYDSNILEDRYIHYVGIDVGGVTGGLYMIIGAETPAASLAIPVFPLAPVHSLAAAGEAFSTNVVVGGGFDLTVAAGAGLAPAFVVAGLADGRVVSIASGIAHNPPAVTSATNASVALGAFHGTNYFVFAGTSGANGGFARSVDGGATFARTGLISDDLDSIVDMAVSPIYDEDGTVYMITEGHSGSKTLWRTTNRGGTWDAVLTEGQKMTSAGGATATVGAFDKVAISPRFASDTSMFVCESATGTIWRSTDNGSSFWALPQKVPTAGTVGSLVAAGIKTVLVGDNLGDFFRTTNGGLTWDHEVNTGLSGFNDMALSPDYGNDQTILAGDSSGNVALSIDDGKTWQEITRGGFGGKDGENVFVAFHPAYPDNGIFFAAGDDAASNLVIDRYDNGWETIFEGDTADTGNATGLVVSPDGTLYGTFFADSHGMFRSLNPLEEDVGDVKFEQVAEGIGVALEALHFAAGSNVLFGFEGSDIYNYMDMLAVPLVLKAPGNGVSTGRVNSAKLEWENLVGADRYTIEVGTEPGFDNAAFYNTSLTTFRLNGLEDGHTYYWRVRVTAGEPTLSRWSEAWSFATGLSAAEWNPFVGGVPEAPSSGATNVSVRPVFAWNPGDLATGYELVVAKDRSFTDLVISKVGGKALTTTVWTSDRDLDYNTTYYWKVRAVSSTGGSQWAMGIFTTEPAPSVSVSPSPPSWPSPSPSPSFETPTYVWVVLAILTVLVITLLALIITARRPS